MNNKEHDKYTKSIGVQDKLRPERNDVLQYIKEKDSKTDRFFYTFNIIGTILLITTLAYGVYWILQQNG